MSRRYLWLVAVAVVVLVAALVLASCGGSTTTTTAAPAGPSTTAGVTTTAGGAVDVAALYTQYCGGCHDTLPAGSADDVRAATENGKGDMPSLKDKLTTEQIAALATWVANGGK